MTKKLAPLYLAPYKILDKLGPLNYRVQALENPADVRSINVGDIELYYHPDTMTSNSMDQPEGGEEEHPAEDLTPGVQQVEDEEELWLPRDFDIGSICQL